LKYWLVAQIFKIFPLRVLLSIHSQLFNKAGCLSLTWSTEINLWVYILCQTGFGDFKSRLSSMGWGQTHWRATYKNSTTESSAYSLYVIELCGPNHILICVLATPVLEDKKMSKWEREMWIIHYWESMQRLSARPALFHCCLHLFYLSPPPTTVSILLSSLLLSLLSSCF